MIVDDWIAKKIGMEKGAALTRAALETWQLIKLRETIERVIAHSSFYREKLLGHNDEPVTGKGVYNVHPPSVIARSIATKQSNGFMTIDSLAGLEGLPFTTSDELASEGSRMVCVPASEVSRIVTLQTTSDVVNSQATSGSTGPPKRVWFTEADQELMTDYIHHGLQVMTGPDDVFLVLMPCERPGSVGDLVALGVERIGSRAVRVGPIPPDGNRDEEVLELMRREGVTTGLATAPTAARLALHDETYNKMRTILLTAQYISEADEDAVESLWGCKVYEHYGMTEMGLGGAMACAERIGYHPREADLLFEIIDPDSGEVLPEGEYGEIVFTTLTRQAMPLIRYRTGDFSRWLPGACPCGSVLKRLDKVGDRSERKSY
jgi:phenylacetate-coenzyme A ligase PaaK-like adenylate-forming protein